MQLGMEPTGHSRPPARIFRLLLSFHALLVALEYIAVSLRMNYTYPQNTKNPSVASLALEESLQKVVKMVFARDSLKSKNGALEGLM